MQHDTTPPLFPTHLLLTVVFHSVQGRNLVKSLTDHHLVVKRQAGRLLHAVPLGCGRIVLRKEGGGKDEGVREGGREGRKEVGAKKEGRKGGGREGSEDKHTHVRRLSLLLLPGQPVPRKTSTHSCLDA